MKLQTILEIHVYNVMEGTGLGMYTGIHLRHQAAK